MAEQNPGLGERPIVRILEESGRKVVPYQLDLESNLSLMIVSCDTIIKYEYAANY